MAKGVKLQLSMRQLSSAAVRDEQHTRVLQDVPGMAELGRLLPSDMGLADRVLLRSLATLPRGDGTRQHVWSDFRLSAPPRRICQYPFFVEVGDLDDASSAVATHYGQVCCRACLPSHHNVCKGRWTHAAAAACI